LRISFIESLPIPFCALPSIIAGAAQARISIAREPGPYYFHTMRPAILPKIRTGFGNLRRSPGRTLLRWAVKAILAFVLSSLALVLFYKWIPVPITATMVMDDKVWQHGLTKDWESLDRIDRNLVVAVIAAEDGKFCSHNGFDTEAIAKAALRNAQGGRIRGGSTITQQTAKNVFLWQGGGYFRKGVEAWFAFLIEHIWGKRRIMEVYLNVAETGIATYGAEAGAERYFNHSAARISQTEAARMAAALPLPKQRPVINPTGFTRRYANTIAARMRVVERDGLDSCVYE
jgi:monofunctional biosynthetic peptidoglycan transglycosylase